MKDSTVFGAGLILYVVVFAAALALAGCGGRATDDLGQADQAIWAAEYYGTAAGSNNSPCNPNAPGVCYLPRLATAAGGTFVYSRWESEGGGYVTIEAILDILGYDFETARVQAAEYFIAKTGWPWNFADAPMPNGYDLVWAYNPNLFVGVPPATSPLNVTQVSRMLCTASVAVTDTPAWPATFRYCNQWQVEVDVQALVGWLNGQPAGQRAVGLRTFVAKVYGRVEGLGLNTAGNPGDLMSRMIPAGVPDQGLNSADSCLVGAYDLSANAGVVEVVNDWCF